MIFAKYFHYDFDLFVALPRSLYGDNFEDNIASE